MEYRAWLADIIVMAANKRGLVTHDTKLIHALIQTVTVAITSVDVFWWEVTGSLGGVGLRETRLLGLHG